MKIPAQVNQAYQIALKAQENSYSPYSHFAVGAALKFVDDDTIYSGCNVENISFGGTVCAERSAIFSRIGQRGKGTIEYALVVANTQNPTPPCALCLQVFSEFCDQDFPIYMGNREEILTRMTFRELLPFSFNTLKEGQRP